MSYNSKHWNWVEGFCYKHRGFKLPCKWCVATNDPDLVYDELKSGSDAVAEAPALPDDSTIPPWIKDEYRHEHQAWI